MPSSSRSSAPPLNRRGLAGAAELAGARLLGAGLQALGGKTQKNEKSQQQEKENPRESSDLPLPFPTCSSSSLPHGGLVFEFHHYLKSEQIPFDRIAQHFGLSSNILRDWLKGFLSSHREGRIDEEMRRFFSGKSTGPVKFEENKKKQEKTRKRKIPQEQQEEEDFHQEEAVEVSDSDPDRPDRFNPHVDDPDREFLVEQVLDRRTTRRGRIYYQIKWQGFDKRWNSWEPDEGVGFLHTVKEFERSWLKKQAEKAEREKHRKKSQPQQQATTAIPVVSASAAKRQKFQEEIIRATEQKSREQEKVKEKTKPAKLPAPVPHVAKPITQTTDTTIQTVRENSAVVENSSQRAIQLKIPKKVDSPSPPVQSPPPQPRPSQVSSTFLSSILPQQFRAMVIGDDPLSLSFCLFHSRTALQVSDPALARIFNEADEIYCCCTDNERGLAERLQNSRDPLFNAQFKFFPKWGVNPRHLIDQFKATPFDAIICTVNNTDFHEEHLFRLIGSFLSSAAGVLNLTNPNVTVRMNCSKPLDEAACKAAVAAVGFRLVKTINFTVGDVAVPGEGKRKFLQFERGKSYVFERMETSSVGVVGSSDFSSLSFGGSGNYPNRRFSMFQQHQQQVPTPLVTQVYQSFHTPPASHGYPQPNILPPHLVSSSNSPGYGQYSSPVYPTAGPQNPLGWPRRNN